MTLTQQLLAKSPIVAYDLSLAETRLKRNASNVISVADTPGDALYSILNLAADTRHLLQTDLARRPLYDVEGSKHFVVSAGAEFMKATYSKPQPWFRVSAVRMLSPTTNVYLFSGATSQAGALNVPIADALRMFSGAFGPNNTNAIVDNDLVVTEIFNGASSILSINGVQVSGNAGTDAGTGLTIFSAFVASGFATARLYRLAEGSGIPDTKTRALYEAWATEAIA